MRVLAYRPGDDGRARGRAHGESFRAEVGELARIRTHLTIAIGGFDDEDQVLAAAARHLPVLEAYHPELYAELVGIAEGAAISPEEVVVLNHYTDLRDLDPRGLDGGDDGCSLIMTRSAEGGLLGQTWDMHATAIPYVMMLHVPARGDAPEAWVLTLTGCLGMAGLNGAGAGIAINNLPSRDARVGVVWPAVVRKVLEGDSAAAGRDVICGSTLGSGHHYLVADRRHAFGIETSGMHRKVIYEGMPTTYVHTNHCLDPEVAACSWVPAHSTTHARYQWLAASVDAEDIAGADDLWRRLGSREGYPNSVSTNRATPENPHGTATCAAIVMNLDRLEVRAHDGFCHNVAPEHFGFGEGAS